MTQQELADLVNVSRQTIMQLKRNCYNPSILLAYSIAKVFDVTIEDLFDFNEIEIVEPVEPAGNQRATVSSVVALLNY